MKRRRLRLKKWVRYVIYSMILLGLIFLFISGCKKVSSIATECDKEMGYTCTYYDIEQYARTR